MENKIEEIIKILTEKGETIATMESCTGGGLVNAITNIPGASNIIKFSAVTYSNEFKIKMGVSSNLINKYSVYSEEVAKSMSHEISMFTGANYGIGITGKINNQDKNNLRGEINCVFFSIYDRNNDVYYTDKIKVTKDSRKSNKEDVLLSIINNLLNIIK